ncbi:hypothetical protein AB0H43_03750 [Hamadaea sp. NPDC050747]|uniref:hypothetical protein n=1 Tax=Hamadaea sp. NPDC050747 TaxID=3155789 RepID=UPI0033CA3AE6
MTAGRIAAIGEQVAVEGFGLAGALAYPAGDPDEVLAAWHSLPADVALVFLTAAADRVVPRRSPESVPLTVVMPG